MIITTVHMNEDGGYIINKNATASDEGELTISGDATGNRHYMRMQAWIDAGNTPTPYVAPVKTWLENRQAEYPKIEELVVALYDTDDKAALEKRRSDTKAKYPKPE